jgi:hypothetical protein
MRAMRAMRAIFSTVPTRFPPLCCIPSRRYESPKFSAGAYKDRLHRLHRLHI